MATRQIKDIVDQTTNQKIYPKTHSKAVFLDNGKTVDVTINELVSSINDIYITLDTILKGERLSRVGDIVYINKYNTQKIISPNKWSNDLGTPLGVIVIPEGFAPDGKARMCTIHNVMSEPGSSSGSGQPSYEMKWSSLFSSADTTLLNYAGVPITTNVNVNATDISLNGYLPSDSFTEITSYTDSIAKYKNSDLLIPSPYLGIDPNPEYYKTLNENNALSDFNGLDNTQVLIQSSSHVAANKAWRNENSIQWYLPAMGELGYLIVRLGVINKSLEILNGTLIQNQTFWSSTESTSDNAYCLNTTNGNVAAMWKIADLYVRAFAIID